MTDTPNQPSAFVIMPFRNDMKWVFTDLISPPLAEAGYSVTRADDPIHQQGILSDIIDGIYRADLLVADLTGVNPNVMYELGVAHAGGIPTFMMIQDVGDAPFDLRAYRLNEYSSSLSEPKSRELLAQKLHEVAVGRMQGKVQFASPVSDRIGEVREKLTASYSSARNHAFGRAASETTRDSEVVIKKAGPAITTAEEYVEYFQQGTVLISTWSTKFELALSNHSSLLNESISNYALLNDTKRGDSRRKTTAAAAAQILESWAQAVDIAVEDLVAASDASEGSTDSLLALPIAELDRVLADSNEIFRALDEFIPGMRKEISKVAWARQQYRDVVSYTKETRAAGAKLTAALDRTVRALELLLAYGQRLQEVLSDALERRHDRDQSQEQAARRAATVSQLRQLAHVVADHPYPPQSLGAQFNQLLADYEARSTLDLSHYRLSQEDYWIDSNRRPPHAYVDRDIFKMRISGALAFIDSMTRG